uniref:ATPase_AAA_core domain-containing protein n=1 Tax=Mesocestoides corti TaxID=53468 RepID=A0A5K3EIS6_MESCO
MMKTQFMALWDGLLSEPDSRIIVIGATNRPSDLDSAILRRLPYKVYVPLPNAQQRLEILKVHLHNEPLDALVTPEFLKSFAEQTEGLSGSDLFEICREAALRGFRAWLHASPSSPQSVESSSTSPAFVNPSISVGDFEYAFRKFKNNQLVETMAVTLPKLHEDDPD